MLHQILKPLLHRGLQSVMISVHLSLSNIDTYFAFTRVCHY